MRYRGLIECRWLFYTAILRAREGRDPKVNRYFALILLAVFELVWIQTALNALGVPRLIADRIGHSKASHLALMVGLTFVNGLLLFTRRGHLRYLRWRESQPHWWLDLDSYVGGFAVALTVVAAVVTIRLR